MIANIENMTTHYLYQLHISYIGLAPLMMMMQIYLIKIKSRHLTRRKYKPLVIFTSRCTWTWKFLLWI